MQHTPSTVWRPVAQHLARWDNLMNGKKTTRFQLEITTPDKEEPVFKKRRRRASNDTFSSAHGDRCFRGILLSTRTFVLSLAYSHYKYFSTISFFIIYLYNKSFFFLVQINYSIFNSQFIIKNTFLFLSN